MTCARCGHAHPEPTLFDPHPACQHREWYGDRCGCPEHVSAEDAEREAIRSES